MTTKREILQVIRKHCLSCCSGSYLMVRDCTPECRLHPYRMGADPNPKRKGRFQKTPSTDNELLKKSVRVMV